MRRLRSKTEDLIARIERAERIDRVSRPVAAWVRSGTGFRRVKNLLSGTWLGHQLHPALTDLPIGAWTAASILDLTAGPRSAESARRLVGVGIVSALPAAVTGASDWSDSYGPEQRAGLVHGVTNSAATLLQSASWLARRRGLHGLGIVLSLGGLGATLAAAYLGGHLTLVRGQGVDHTAFQAGSPKWNDVAAEADLNEGALVRVEVDDVPVVLVKREGRVHALSATCTHAGGPLDEGEIDDGCIVCPWHGSRFGLTDGEVARGPATVRQPVWEVHVSEGRVAIRQR